MKKMLKARLKIPGTDTWGRELDTPPPLLFFKFRSSGIDTLILRDKEEK